MSRTSFTAGLAVASLASATLASGLFAEEPVTGDAFADALPQASSSWIATVDLAGATLEPGESADERTGSVWLSWTAATDASITLHTESASTGLALYSGTSLGEAEELAFSVTGDVASSVTAGSTYRVQVSTIGAVDAAAPVTVKLTEAPLEQGAPEAFDPAPAPHGPAALFGVAPYNDKFAAAAPQFGDSWTTFVDNESGTTETGERVIFDEYSPYRAVGTVWLKWTAPASGAISVDTYGSATEETSLAVFTGTKVATAARLAANDDAAQGDHRSRITSLPVIKGVVYYVQVGSSAKSAVTGVFGSMQVNLVGTYAAPSNDNKGKAPAMTGSKWTAAGTTIGATIESGFEPTSNPDTAANTRKNSIWWKWTAIAAGPVTLASVGTNSTIYLAAFESTPSIGMIPVDFDQDLNSHGAALSFTATAGSTYYFQAGDMSDTRGTVKLQFAATYTGPYISKVAAVSGKLAGGNSVTITGTHLAGVTSVKFGTVSSFTLTHVGETKIVVKVPAGVAKGKVAVLAYAGSVHSYITTAAHYTYI